MRFAIFLIVLLGCWTDRAADAFEQISFTPKCGIENCHGFNVTCGPNVPETCTAMYALGDFCRDFIRCETRDGACVENKSPQFDGCAACVGECNKMDGGPEAFECEARCREQFPLEMPTSP